MNGKGVLKVISGLFLGVQLISFARGAALTSCANVANMDEECDGATSTSKYCIHSDGKIYEIETNEGCAIKGTQIQGAGIKVFDDDGSNAGGFLKTTTGIGTQVNYSVYRCTGTGAATTCEQTYGYVQLDENVCTIGKEGSPACVAATSIVAACDGADIGSLCSDSGIKVKLTATPDLTKKIDDDGAVVNYMMKNVASNVFTNAVSAGEDNVNPVKKNIIIEARENAIVLLSNSYDYCEGDDGVVVPTFKDFCANANDDQCQKILECTNGLCKRNEVTCTIIALGGSASPGCNGFYIGTSASGGALVTNTATAGTLFDCTDGTCVVYTSFKVGYYKYADNAEQYIKCSAVNSCKPVDIVSGKSDCSAGVSVGDVINDGDDNILCLDATEKGGVILAEGNTYDGNYLMNGIAEGIMNTKPAEFVIVTVSGETVKLADKVANSIPRYKYTSDVYKVYERDTTTKTADVCTAPNVIVEYKHKENDEGHNYYEVHVTHTNE
ncbi:hypothetical protein PIROE2DRAFT_68490 [Piromyces sp. E2]|nr:hypothetical protein PIROE2DRAFT_68490 [Piromyces sp. E2]|eukprot:OUM69766.1 hypothetical protein PIROE2DRAFT_68490 [Piromyces sp. E2]